VRARSIGLAVLASYVAREERSVSEATRREANSLSDGEGEAIAVLSGAPGGGGVGEAGVGVLSTGWGKSAPPGVGLRAGSVPRQPGASASEEGLPVVAGKVLGG